ncbi:MAG TPA: hypothetical protein VLB84_04490 [Bacteroidia bacterium]|nr:hypothetical protein [Bacteroidia bacterium]
MAIETVLYSPIKGNNGWRQMGINSVTTVNSNKASHSERHLFNTYDTGKNSLFLIVQNAYPCEYCHDFFKEQSRTGKSIIFKITANSGNYSSDHGMGLHGSVPCIIYYHNGDFKRVSMSSRGQEINPPNGFPETPDFDHY